MKQNTRNLKKETKKAVIAATTSASLLVGSVYDSPDELLKNTTEEPLIETVRNDIMPEPAVQETVQDNSFKTRFRSWFSSLPQIIRITVGLPLYAAGSALLWAFKGITTRLLSSEYAAFVYVLLAGVIIMLLHMLTKKIVDPLKPLKQLADSDTLIITAVTLGVIVVTALVAPRIWESYDDYSRQLTLATVGISLLAGGVQYASTRTVEPVAVKETQLIASDDFMTISNNDI